MRLNRRKRRWGINLSHLDWIETNSKWHCAMKLDKSISAIVTGGASGLGKAVVRLLNCAGTGHPAKTASRDKVTGIPSHMPIKDFERIIQINLIGTFRCIAKSAAGMMTLDPDHSGERGVIVNTASVAAQDGQVGQASYSASKAAIVGLTLPVARDFMDEGIRVNVILPGIFDTPLMQAAPENVKVALASAVPFPKRFGAPEEFAHLAETMITNGYLNGESVRLDGGIRMAPR